jgi:hypothetical protein
MACCAAAALPVQLAQRRLKPVLALFAHNAALAPATSSLPATVSAAAAASLAAPAAVLAPATSPPAATLTV